MIFFGILVLIAVLIIYLFEKRYEKFVVENSLALKKLKGINQRYSFIRIQNFNMKHAYDNEVAFDNVSPQDYLIYQLVLVGNEVYTAINCAAENSKLYALYCEEIKTCSFGEYGDVEVLKNTEKLLSVEKRLFDNEKYSPTITLSILVTIYQTAINGDYRGKKSQIFNSNEILGLLDRVKNKKEDFYLDEEIWRAICRVERGKVSNKMRFSIYKRDRYRCRKCGRSTDNLEIDHIFPISKGGKSTYNNLQTLCHECNVLKSNTLEHNAPNPYARRHRGSEICEKCGAPLIVRIGKYGEFYGCSNYPECRFTKQL